MCAKENILLTKTKQYFTVIHRGCWNFGQRVGEDPAVQWFWSSYCLKVKSDPDTVLRSSRLS